MVQQNETEVKDILKSLNDLDKVVLLLLHANNGKPIPGALWLQKELYLLQKAFPSLSEESGFEPHFYGPYSETLTDEVDLLKEANLVDIKLNQYKLTKQGDAIANALNPDKTLLEKIEEFKEFMNDMSWDELLGFTYFSHENPDELEKESVEYKRLVLKREAIAISLYLKDKISAQKASQIAGIDIEDFMKALKKAMK